MDETLDPLTSVFGSPFVREFPFDLFGLQQEDLFGLIKDEPGKAGALIQTFVEIGQMYDVRVEHFLFSALRAYQQMNNNYFEDLEDSAAAYRQSRGWTEEAPIEEEALRRVLEADYGYRIDETTLPEDPVLKGFRSVFVKGKPPRLLVNGRLLPSQKAFIYGREIGYLHHGLTERAVTSSWLKVESFGQVFNNYKASYFSGALLIDGDGLERDLKALFAQRRWDGDALLAIMARYKATPEMFFYRLSELLPGRFGLGQLYSMRFSHDLARDRFRLTKLLNMSQVSVPHGVWLNEHYCRRWPAIKLLRRLAERPAHSGRPVVLAERSHFFNEDAEFFVVAMARPLALTEGANSCVSLGFLLDDAFKQQVRFWDDPQVPRVEVNLTCERCGLAPLECLDRAADPVIYRAEEDYKAQERALERLLGELKT